jgi:hypothetical protein
VVRDKETKFYNHSPAMKVSENYDVREFVPKETFDKFGDKAIWFVNPNLVKFAEWLSEQFGVHAVVNNWHTGGQYQYSGYRPPTYTQGAKESQHRCHNATDNKVAGVDPERVREEIRNNFKDLHDKFGITTIEKDCPTWTHVDCRWTNQDNLLEVPYQ